MGSGPAWCGPVRPARFATSLKRGYAVQVSRRQFKTEEQIREHIQLSSLYRVSQNSIAQSMRPRANVAHNYLNHPAIAMPGLPGESGG